MLGLDEFRGVRMLWLWEVVDTGFKYRVFVLFVIWEMSSSFF